MAGRALAAELAPALALALLDGAWEAAAMAARLRESHTISPAAARLAARWAVQRFTTPPIEAALTAALIAALTPAAEPLADGLDPDAADEEEREEDADAEDGGQVGRGVRREAGWRPGEPRVVELALLEAALRAPRPPGVPRLRRWHLPPLAGFSPAEFAPTLPAISTDADVVAALGLTGPDLSFLAGPHLRVRSRPAARSHYRYRWVPKRIGAHRLIEAPKERLKRAQRALLRVVLAHVPHHAAAHAFVPGRSARTFAAVHAGAPVVVRVDLEDFFGSVGEARVRALFGALGYPSRVARLFSALTCHRTPREILRACPVAAAAAPELERTARSRKRLDRPHLPQGAPTSPALASLAAYGLDVRLTALARRFDATYARYADDLAFSGDVTLARSRATLLALVTRIANDEGFAVRFDKTRVMPSSARQELVGLVVNRWPDVSRHRYDALRARLHAVACGRGVPQGAEERALLMSELRGHVEWASARPHRARKLAALLDRAAASLRPR